MTRIPWESERRGEIEMGRKGEGAKLRWGEGTMGRWGEMVKGRMGDGAIGRRKRKHEVGRLKKVVGWERRLLVVGCWLSEA